MSLMRMHSLWYWSAFFLALLAFAALESLRPWRLKASERPRRWTRHTLLYALVSVLVVAVYRTSPILVAVMEADRGSGILGRTTIPFALRCVIGLLAIDFVRYVVHRAHHRFSFLWRFHWAHHSDPDIDLTTSLRTHPVESILVFGSNLALISLLAVPPLTILIADIVGPALGMFHHANIVVPRKVQRVLQWLLVTLEAHRLHHSQEIGDQSSNFGVTFPWWDMAFRTYRLRPANNAQVEFGLKGFQNDERSLNIGFLLLHPLSRMRGPTLD